MAFSWTDELRAEAVEKYLAENPTEENSMEVVKQVAEELGATPNGVRMVLTKADVYIKKTPTSKASSGGSTTKRVSKADAVNELTTAIESLGLEVDEDIINKLTGKAALYFAGLLNSTNNSD